MAEQQAAAAQPTLTQVNAEFLSSRASRLDSAITKALEAKMPAPPKPKAAAPTASPSAAASGTPAPSAPSPAASETAPADAESAALEAVEAEPGAGVPAELEPQGEALEGPAVDVAALNALAKKKDLRAIEKQLGLEPGVLGATNADYAAYRRRVDEVETRAKTVETTHESNNQTLINKFGPTVDLLTHAQKGNLQAYAMTIERTTGISIQAFVNHWAKNIQQLDPRTLQLEQENARLRAQGQIVTQDGRVEQPAAAPTKEAATTKATAYVTAEAKDHAALKLKGGVDEVRKVWLASFVKATKSFALTPVQAADKVLETRRKERESESWILSGQTKPTPPRTRAISRTGSSETQVRAKTPLTRDQLIERGAEQMRRQKAADARANRR